MARKTTITILCGALIVGISLGIRHVFGLFLTPMTSELGFGREAFALALALQNILWGLFQPLTGMLADRFGSARVIVAGSAAYALGLVVMSATTTPLVLSLGAGLLVGFGLAAGGFAVVLGAVGRMVPPARRSLALGIVTAGGSFGQFVMAPLGQAMISSVGWPGALLVMAGFAVLLAPLAFVLRGRAADPLAATAGAPSQTISQAVAEAARHRGYRLLTMGFFVCGFQVTFIGVHLPAYLADMGLPVGLAALTLGLIGFFNIFGAFGFGALGDRYSKKYLLSTLYALRAVVIAAYLVAPKTETTTLLFAAAIGLLWLGTVPLTSGLVAQIFGPRYMATLFGFVFLSHQVGSFLGVWLGGRVFDAFGTYDPIWIAAIVLGLVAALLHLPISEKSLRAAA